MMLITLLKKITLAWDSNINDGEILATISVDPQWVVLRNIFALMNIIEFDVVQASLHPYNGIVTPP